MSTKEQRAKLGRIKKALEAMVEMAIANLDEHPDEIDVVGNIVLGMYGRTRVVQEHTKWL